nr:hypothetical protein [Glycomyces terrestris]
MQARAEEHLVDHDARGGAVHAALDRGLRHGVGQVEQERRARAADGGHDVHHGLLDDDRDADAVEQVLDLGQVGAVGGGERGRGLAGAGGDVRHGAHRGHAVGEAPGEGRERDAGGERDDRGVRFEGGRDLLEDAFDGAGPDGDEHDVGFGDGARVVGADLDAVRAGEGGGALGGLGGGPDLRGRQARVEQPGEDGLAEMADAEYRDVHGAPPPESQSNGPRPPGSAFRTNRAPRWRPGHGRAPPAARVLQVQSHGCSARGFDASNRTWSRRRPVFSE